MRTWAEKAQRQVTTPGLPFEWVAPDTQDRAAAKWSEHYLNLTISKLRVAPPLTAYQLNITPQALRRFSTRRAPPAFAVTDLSFRVVYPTRQCPPDSPSPLLGP